MNKEHLLRAIIILLSVLLIAGSFKFSSGAGLMLPVTVSFFCFLIFIVFEAYLRIQHNIDQVQSVKKPYESTVKNTEDVVLERGRSTRVSFKEPESRWPALLLLLDIFALYVVFLIMGVSGIIITNGFFHYLQVFYLFWIFLIFGLGLYRDNFFENASEIIFSAGIFTFFAFTEWGILSYLFPGSGALPLLQFCINIFLFEAVFLILRSAFILAREKWFREKAVIIGSGVRLKEILPALNARYNIYCIFPFSRQAVFMAEEIKKTVAENKITAVIVVPAPELEKELVQNFLFALPSDVNLISFASLYETIKRKIPLEHLDEEWFLENISRREKTAVRIIRRASDLVFAFFLFLIFLIFLLPFIIIIRMNSSGPIFYSDWRITKDGRKFKMHKFKTIDPNSLKIMKFCRFLRESHVDELPQFLNILKGDMSFIGPRPDPFDHGKVYEKCTPFYFKRHAVKSGVFGWAQINFPASRNVEEMKQKLEYDLYYAKNRSLFLDLEIILKAVKGLFWNSPGFTHLDNEQRTSA